MQNLMVFVGVLSVTLGFPLDSPLHARERHRRQLGYGYGPVYPLHPFHRPNRHNDFTPEIYIRDRARPSIRRPVTPKPRVTPSQRLTSSLVQPVTFDDLCAPTRGDGLNDDRLPVLVLVDPKDLGLTAADRPLSPDPSASSNLQPVFLLVPAVFLPASKDGQVQHVPALNPNGLKTPDPLRIAGSNQKLG